MEKVWLAFVFVFAVTTLAEGQQCSEDCQPDFDGDRVVEINELVRAVNLALNDCPAGVPTLTPTQIAEPTTTPTMEQDAPIRCGDAVTSAIEPPGEIETFTFTLDEPRNIVTKLSVQGVQGCIEIRPAVPGGELDCAPNNLQVEKDFDIPAGTYVLLVSTPARQGFEYSLSLTCLPPKANVCDRCPIP